MHEIKDILPLPKLPVKVRRVKVIIQLALLGLIASACAPISSETSSIIGANEEFSLDISNDDHEGSGNVSNYEPPVGVEKTYEAIVAPTIEAAVIRPTEPDPENYDTTMIYPLIPKAMTELMGDFVPYESQLLANLATSQRYSWSTAIASGEQTLVSTATLLNVKPLYPSTGGPQIVENGRAFYELTFLTTGHSLPPQTNLLSMFSKAELPKISHYTEFMGTLTTSHIGIPGQLGENVDTDGSIFSVSISFPILNDGSVVLPPHLGFDELAHTELLPPGTPIVGFGYPQEANGEGGVRYYGYTTDDPEIIILDTVPSSPRSSGTPMFTQDGRLVGIIVSNFAAINGGQTQSRIIPASTLVRLFPILKTTQ